MNKKILVICLMIVIFIVGIFLGSSNTLDSMISSNNNEFQEVVVGGISFQIPVDYKSINYSNKNLGEIISDGINTTIDAKGYSDSKSNIIFIFVSKFNQTNFANDSFNNLNGTHKVINGHQGILTQNKNSTKFSYLYDDYNLVVVDAPNESLIEKIIK